MHSSQSNTINLLMIPLPLAPRNAELDFSSHGYKWEKIIGSGQFGKAHLLKHIETGLFYVGKAVDFHALPDRERVRAMEESNLMGAVSSPFVVSRKESFEHHGQQIIIVEYCNGGDLHDAINKRIREGKGSFDDAVILKWFLQLCLGLHAIHSVKIVHRDIKTKNIFLTQEGDLKIGDFGISRTLQKTAETGNTMGLTSHFNSLNHGSFIFDQTASFAQTNKLSVVGTPQYMSPEMCNSLPYSYPTDIWALGCVLFEILSLRHPFDARSLGGVIQKILSVAHPPLPIRTAPLLKETVLAMLSRDQRLRPSLSHILKMPEVIMQMNSMFDPIVLARALPNSSQPPPPVISSSLPTPNVSPLGSAPKTLPTDHQHLHATTAATYFLSPCNSASSPGFNSSLNNTNVNTTHHLNKNNNNNMFQLSASRTNTSYTAMSRPLPPLKRKHAVLPCSHLTEGPLPAPLSSLSLPALAHPMNIHIRSITQCKICQMEWGAVIGPMTAAKILIHVKRSNLSLSHIIGHITNAVPVSFLALRLRAFLPGLACSDFELTVLYSIIAGGVADRPVQISVLEKQLGQLALHAPEVRISKAILSLLQSEISLLQQHQQQAIQTQVLPTISEQIIGSNAMTHDDCGPASASPHYGFQDSVSVLHYQQQQQLSIHHLPNNQNFIQNGVLDDPSQVIMSTPFNMSSRHRTTPQLLLSPSPMDISSNQNISSSNYNNLVGNYRRDSTFIASMVNSEDLNGMTDVGGFSPSPPHFHNNLSGSQLQNSQFVANSRYDVTPPLFDPNNNNNNQYVSQSNYDNRQIHLQNDEEISIDSDDNANLMFPNDDDTFIDNRNIISQKLNEFWSSSTDPVTLNVMALLGKTKSGCFDVNHFLDSLTSVSNSSIMLLNQHQHLQSNQMDHHKSLNSFLAKNSNQLSIQQQSSMNNIFANNGEYLLNMQHQLPSGSKHAYPNSNSNNCNNSTVLSLNNTTNTGLVRYGGPPMGGNATNVMNNSIRSPQQKQTHHQQHQQSSSFSILQPLPTAYPSTANTSTNASVSNVNGANNQSHTNKNLSSNIQNSRNNCINNNDNNFNNSCVAGLNDSSVTYVQNCNLTGNKKENNNLCNIENSKNVKISSGLNLSNINVSSNISTNEVINDTNNFPIHNSNNNNYVVFSHTHSKTSSISGLNNIILSPSPTPIPDSVSLPRPSVLDSPFNATKPDDHNKTVSNHHHQEQSPLRTPRQSITSQKRSVASSHLSKALPPHPFHTINSPDKKNSSSILSSSNRRSPIESEPSPVVDKGNEVDALTCRMSNGLKTLPLPSLPSLETLINQNKDKHDENKNETSGKKNTRPVGLGQAPAEIDVFNSVTVFVADVKNSGKSQLEESLIASLSLNDMSKESKNSLPSFIPTLSSEPKQIGIDIFNILSKEEGNYNSDNVVISQSDILNADETSQCPVSSTEITQPTKNLQKTIHESNILTHIARSELQYDILQQSSDELTLNRPNVLIPPRHTFLPEESSSSVVSPNFLHQSRPHFSLPAQTPPPAPLSIHLPYIKNLLSPFLMMPPCPCCSAPAPPVDSPGMMFLLRPSPSDPLHRSSTSSVNHAHNNNNHHSHSLNLLPPPQISFSPSSISPNDSPSLSPSLPACSVDPIVFEHKDLVIFRPPPNPSSRSQLNFSLSPIPPRRSKSVHSTKSTLSPSLFSSRDTPLAKTTSGFTTYRHQMINCGPGDQNNNNAMMVSSGVRENFHSPHRNGSALKMVSASARMSGSNHGETTSNHTAVTYNVPVSFLKGRHSTKTILGKHLKNHYENDDSSSNEYEDDNNSATSPVNVIKQYGKTITDIQTLQSSNTLGNHAAPYSSDDDAESATFLSHFKGKRIHTLIPSSSSSDTDDDGDIDGMRKLPTIVDRADVTFQLSSHNKLKHEMSSVYSKPDSKHDDTFDDDSSNPGEENEVETHRITRRTPFTKSDAILHSTSFVHAACDHDPDADLADEHDKANPKSWDCTEYKEWSELSNGKAQQQQQQHKSSLNTGTDDHHFHQANLMNDKGDDDDDASCFCSDTASISSTGSIWDELVAKEVEKSSFAFDFVQFTQNQINNSNFKNIENNNNTNQKYHFFEKLSSSFKSRPLTSLTSTDDYLQLPSELTALLIWRLRASCYDASFLMLQKMKRRHRKYNVSRQNELQANAKTFANSNIQQTNVSYLDTNAMKDVDTQTKNKLNSGNHNNVSSFMLNSAQPPRLSPTSPLCEPSSLVHDDSTSVFNPIPLPTLTNCRSVWSCLLDAALHNPRPLINPDAKRPSLVQALLPDDLLAACDIYLSKSDLTSMLSLSPPFSGGLDALFSIKEAQLFFDSVFDFLSDPLVESTSLNKLMSLIDSQQVHQEEIDADDKNNKTSSCTEPADISLPLLLVPLLHPPGPLIHSFNPPNGAINTLLPVASNCVSCSQQNSTAPSSIESPLPPRECGVNVSYLPPGSVTPIASQQTSHTAACLPSSLQTLLSNDMLHSNQQQQQSSSAVINSNDNSSHHHLDMSFNGVHLKSPVDLNSSHLGSPPSPPPLAPRVDLLSLLLLPTQSQCRTHQQPALGQEGANSSASLSAGLPFSTLLGGNLQDKDNQIKNINNSGSTQGMPVSVPLTPSKIRPTFNSADLFSLGVPPLLVNSSSQPNTSSVSSQQVLNKNHHQFAPSTIEVNEDDAKRRKELSDIVDFHNKSVSELKEKIKMFVKTPNSFIVGGCRSSVDNNDSFGDVKPGEKTGRSINVCESTDVFELRNQQFNNTGNKLPFDYQYSMKQHSVVLHEKRRISLFALMLLIAVPDFFFSPEVIQSSLSVLSWLSQSLQSPEWTLIAQTVDRIVSSVEKPIDVVDRPKRKFFFDSSLHLSSVVKYNLKTSSAPCTPGKPVVDFHLPSFNTDEIADLVNEALRPASGGKFLTTSNFEPLHAVNPDSPPLSCNTSQLFGVDLNISEIDMFREDSDVFRNAKNEKQTNNDWKTPPPTRNTKSMSLTASSDQFEVNCQNSLSLNINNNISIPLIGERQPSSTYGSLTCSLYPSGQDVIEVDPHSRWGVALAVNELAQPVKPRSLVPNLNKNLKGAELVETSPSAFPNQNPSRSDRFFTGGRNSNMMVCDWFEPIATESSGTNQLIEFEKGVKKTEDGFLFYMESSSSSSCCFSCSSFLSSSSTSDDDSSHHSDSFDDEDGHGCGASSYLMNDETIELSRSAVHLDEYPATSLKNNLHHLAPNSNSTPILHHLSGHINSGGDLLDFPLDHNQMDIRSFCSSSTRRNDRRHHHKKRIQCRPPPSAQCPFWIAEYALATSLSQLPAFDVSLLLLLASKTPAGSLYLSLSDGIFRSLHGWPTSEFDYCGADLSHSSPLPLGANHSAPGSMAPHRNGFSSRHFYSSQPTGRVNKNSHHSAICTCGDSNWQQSLMTTPQMQSAMLGILSSVAVQYQFGDDVIDTLHAMAVRGQEQLQRLTSANSPLIIQQQHQFLVSEASYPSNNSFFSPQSNGPMGNASNFDAMNYYSSVVPMNNNNQHYSSANNYISNNNFLYSNSSNINQISNPYTQAPFTSPFPPQQSQMLMALNQPSFNAQLLLSGRQPFATPRNLALNNNYFSNSNTNNNFDMFGIQSPKRFGNLTRTRASKSALPSLPYPPPVDFANSIAEIKLRTPICVDTSEVKKILLLSNNFTASTRDSPSSSPAVSATKISNSLASAGGGHIRSGSSCIADLLLDVENEDLVVNKLIELLFGLLCERVAPPEMSMPHVSVEDTSNGISKHAKHHFHHSVPAAHHSQAMVNSKGKLTSTKSIISTLQQSNNQLYTNHQVGLISSSYQQQQQQQHSHHHNHSNSKMTENLAVAHFRNDSLQKIKKCLADLMKMTCHSSAHKKHFGRCMCFLNTNTNSPNNAHHFDRQLENFGGFNHTSHPQQSQTNLKPASMNSTPQTDASQKPLFDSLLLNSLLHPANKRNQSGARQDLSSSTSFHHTGCPSTLRTIRAVSCLLPLPTIPVLVESSASKDNIIHSSFSSTLPSHQSSNIPTVSSLNAAFISVDPFHSHLLGNAFINNNNSNNNNNNSETSSHTAHILHPSAIYPPSINKTSLNAACTPPPFTSYFSSAGQQQSSPCLQVKFKTGNDEVLLEAPCRPCDFSDSNSDDDTHHVRARNNSSTCFFSGIHSGKDIDQMRTVTPTSSVGDLSKIASHQPSSATTVKNNMISLNLKSSIDVEVSPPSQSNLLTDALIAKNRQQQQQITGNYLQVTSDSTVYNSRFHLSSPVQSHPLLHLDQVEDGAYQQTNHPQVSSFAIPFHQQFQQPLLATDNTSSNRHFSPEFSSSPSPRNNNTSRFSLAHNQTPLELPPHLPFPRSPNTPSNNFAANFSVRPASPSSPPLCLPPQSSLVITPLNAITASIISSLVSSSATCSNNNTRPSLCATSTNATSRMMQTSSSSSSRPLHEGPRQLARILRSIGGVIRRSHSSIDGRGSLFLAPTLEGSAPWTDTANNDDDREFQSVDKSVSHAEGDADLNFDSSTLPTRRRNVSQGVASVEGDTAAETSSTSFGSNSTHSYRAGCPSGCNCLFSKLNIAIEGIALQRKLLSSNGGGWCEFLSMRDLILAPLILRTINTIMMFIRVRFASGQYLPSAFPLMRNLFAAALAVSREGSLIVAQFSPRFKNSSPHWRIIIRDSLYDLMATRRGFIEDLQLPDHISKLIFMRNSMLRSISAAGPSASVPLSRAHSFVGRLSRRVPSGGVTSPSKSPSCSTPVHTTGKKFELECTTSPAATMSSPLQQSSESFGSSRNVGGSTAWTFSKVNSHQPSLTRAASPIASADDPLGRRASFINKMLDMLKTLDRNETTMRRSYDEKKSFSMKVYIELVSEVLGSIKVLIDDVVSNGDPLTSVLKHPTILNSSNNNNNTNNNNSMNKGNSIVNVSSTQKQQQQQLTRVKSDSQAGSLPRNPSVSHPLVSSANVMHHHPSHPKIASSPIDNPNIIQIDQRYGSHLKISNEQQQQQHLIRQVGFNQNVDNYPNIHSFKQIKEDISSKIPQLNVYHNSQQFYDLHQTGKIDDVNLPSMNQPYFVSHSNFITSNSSHQTHVSPQQIVPDSSLSSNLSHHTQQMNQQNNVQQQQQQHFLNHAFNPQLQQHQIFPFVQQHTPLPYPSPGFKRPMQQTENAQLTQMMQPVPHLPVMPLSVLPHSPAANAESYPKPNM